MKKSINRWTRLSMESLESRELLSVSPNGIDTPVTNAESVVVTTRYDVVDDTDDVISLREAISQVDTGGTITFDLEKMGGKTIELTSGELTISKSLTIDATSITGGITVDAKQASRVFEISGGTTENPVALKGLTITGGKASNGGGIYGRGTLTLTLTNCEVSGNTASKSGGGICAYSGALTLTNCTVSGNTASYGGGIYAYVGALTLTNCTVSGNTASHGGGILSNNDTLTLTNCTVSGNTASSAGGGIYARGTLTLTNCTVSGNTASSSRGGGIYARDTSMYASGTSTLTLTNCEVSGNMASYGGGIYARDTLTLTLTNCKVSGNEAYDYGGGIYAEDTLTLTNCEVSGNTAYYDGGGICAYSGTLTTLTNCTVSGNTATHGGGIYAYLGALTLTNCTVSGNTASNKGGGIYAEEVSELNIYNSIVSKNYAGSSESNIHGTLSSDSRNNLIGGDPHFEETPKFKNGKLENTPNLHLTEESTDAIDRGDNTCITDKNLLTDVTGKTARIHGDTVDIGAYEYRSTSPETASIIVTTLYDIVDSYDGLISLREAINYSTSNGTVTFHDWITAPQNDWTAGIITLKDDTEYQTLIIDKDLTIDASTLTDGITVSGDDKNRIFLIGDNDKSAISVTLKGLTLTKGYAEGSSSGTGSGGAIAVRNATLTLSGAMAFTDNHSTNGGGAIYIQSNATVKTEAETTSLSFSNNYCGAGKNGGAINNSGILTLTGATFTGNSAKEGKVKTETSDFTWDEQTTYGSGGAIINWKTATLTDCTFTTNYADNGGAIANGMKTGDSPAYATLTIKQTQDYKGPMFSQNESFYGGAIINAGKMQIGEENQASTITLSSNTAHNNGGAISNTANGTTLDLDNMYATLYNAKLSNNTALNGGAIVNQTALTTAQNSVFTGNSATDETGSGGAIDVLKDATLTTTDTTFTSNTATNGFGGALQVWGTATLGDGTTIGVLSLENGLMNAIPNGEDEEEEENANSAKYGGGLSITETGKVTLSSASAQKLVTIAGNTATYGGGVYAYGDLILGENTSIASNEASKNGGGISLTYVTKTEDSKQVSYCGSLKVTGANNTISGNKAGTEKTEGTTYYGGGIIANRGTYIDIANNGGVLTLSNNDATKGQDVALDCVALLNSAYKTLHATGDKGYINRCAEIYYSTTLDSDTGKVKTFTLTSFELREKTTSVEEYTVSGQEKTKRTSWEAYKDGIDLEPAVDDLTFDIYGNGASISYNLPKSGSKDPTASNDLLENALNAYLEEEMVY